MPEAKIEISNLTLAFLVEELKTTLLNAYINKVQEMPGRILKLKVHTQKGDRTLLVTPNALYFTQYPTQAKQNATGFSSFLKKHLNNERILNLEQIQSERILKATFRNFYLYFELFAEGNIILTDLENKIIMPFKPKSWSVRTLKKGEIYKLPPSRGLNPKTVSLTDFSFTLKKSEKTLVRALISTVNIAPVIAEQICFYFKLDKEMKLSKLTEKQLKQIYQGIQDFYVTPFVKPGKINPTLLAIKNKQILLPSPLDIYTDDVVKLFGFSTPIYEALDELNIDQISRSGEQEKTETKHSKRIGELEHSIEEQHRIRKEAEEIILSAAKAGELIYTHYPQLAEAMAVVNKEISKKSTEKDIMYKVSSVYSFIKKVDLRKKEIVVDLD